MTIRFYANDKNEKALSAAFELEKEAFSLGLKIASFGEPADVTIVLGGDGTILRARRMYPKEALLGFNLGGLGYLAGVGQSDFAKALEMLSSGKFKVAERTLVEVKKTSTSEKAIALNEISIMREMTGHAAIIELAVDGIRAARYMADGVIIATPTGSTAYSLASGGPVVMPDSKSFAITPVNPHALAVRPLVISDGVEIKISSVRKINGTAEMLGVYSDGESVFKLCEDETLEIAKSQEVAKFIELEGFNPYEVLGRKLGWS
ncbi:MAG: NAD(+)/NADH kinase [Kiritimatiellae bacterium]|nr:NAD(+)/NADH kinase [Kiritimatiellia bacterium]